ncbi:hypothetical protein ACLKA6_004113 [Drosophila palustris]
MEPVVRQSEESDVVQNAQPKITTFVHKPVPASKTQQIDRQLVRMIAKGHHALRMVEEPEFKKFVEVVSQAPGYKLPTRKTLTTSLIPKLCDEYGSSIMENLNAATAVCLTTDGWTSCTNESYLAVTVHFIEQNTTVLTSYTIACQCFEESHTSLNLCGFLKEVVGKWDLQNKVSAIASDNAYNIVGAIKIGNWRHVPCFAHSLNLIVQKALDEISGVRTKAKAIVEFFNRSTSAQKKLKDMQALLKLPELKLTQDVPTRWNSTYKMFKRLATLKEAVMATISTLRSDLILSSDDWKIVEGVLPILQPFFQITEEVSAEKNVTLSKVIVLVGILQKKMAIMSTLEEDHTLAAVIEKISIEMIERFKDYEYNVLYAESTILDPRFKGRVFKSQEAFKKSVAEIKKKISATRSAIAPPEAALRDDSKQQLDSDDGDDVWKEFDSAFQQVSKPINSTVAAIREMDKYLAEEYLNRKDDPLIWWDQRKSQYPHLYTYMLKRLCIVATSVPCERIFSSAGETVRKRRSLLKPQNVENLMFLHNNM